MTLISWIHLRAKYTDLPLRLAQRLGVDLRGDTPRPTVSDGVLGPQTQGSSYLDRARLPPIVQVAMSDVWRGAQEAGGNNRGPWPAQYNGGFDAEAGRRWHDQPWRQGAWCAGAVSSWLMRAGIDAPYILGAQRLGMALRDMYARVDVSDIRPGDVMVWDRDGPDADKNPSNDMSGHIGLVAHAGDGIIVTIEGNRGGYPAPVRTFAYPARDPSMTGGPLLFAVRPQAC